MFLTRIALRNPVSVLMISILVVVLALFSIARIPIDTLPKLTIPVLQIITPYSGADPKTVEQSVTYPMEKAISSVSGISYIQSFSKEGISIVRAYFGWGTNIDTSEVEAIQRANAILSNLPPGVGNPFVLKFDISNFPVIALAIQSKQLDERALYDLAFNTIEPQIEHVDGVSTAPVNGGRVRQINIYIDRNKLAGMGLTLQNIYQAVGDANFLFPSGDIKVGRIDYRVYTQTQFKEVSPMNAIVVAIRNGVPIHLSDIGQVIDSAAVQTQIVRVNGQHGVMMFVTKQPGQNTVEVVDNIKRAVRALEARLQKTTPDLKIREFFDQSISIRDSIHSLFRESVLGGVLAGLVILVFLRSFLSTAFVSISMPLSALAAILLLFLTGQTFNTFTLGGLTLAMGRLVDDAIVVIENIFRHLNKGEDRLASALHGTEEVGMPVLASTITTVVVFLPILFLQGFPRIIFTPLALTVTFALFASYITSLAIIPVLSRRWLKPEVVQPNASAWTERLSARLHFFHERLSQRYGHTLDWVLGHRLFISASLVIVFFLSLFTMKFIGKELIPNPDENLFIVIGRAPIGTRLENTEKVVQACETIIRQVIPGEEISVIASDLGIPSTQRGTNVAAAAFSQNPGPHGFTIRVNLVPAGKRKHSVEENVGKVRKALVGKFPGISIYPSPAGLTYFLLNLGAQGAIDVQIQGFDLDKGFGLARQVAELISTTPGAADAQIKLENDYPEIHVTANREKASLLGLSQRQVADTILTALNGNTSSNSVWTDPVSGNQYNLLTQFPREYQRTVEDVRDIPFRSLTGKSVHLRDFAEVKVTNGPLEIDRQNQIRMIDVTANAVGKPLGDVAQQIQDRIQQEIKLPEGFSINVAGQFTQQKQSFGQMPFALLMAMLLVYAIMASQFRSLVDPFIIIFTVPLGIIGVLWILLLTRTTLSIESFMGIITMIGIVVSNGILLVEYANRLRRQGGDARAAIIEAGKIRLRPILMTAIATIVGLIPMALGMGAGSETHAPLARTVIGGLAVSTFLTLFFIPILYTLMERKETQIGDDI